MKILVTGADGFVGRNLVENLKNLRDGKNRTRPSLAITQIYEYDVTAEVHAPVDTACQPAEIQGNPLTHFCTDCDFVFHFAGVNRPKAQTKEEEAQAFQAGNRDALVQVLDALKAAHNPCPVMFASSTQAFLTGRFADSEYGRSKLSGEEVLRAYAQETGAKILIYRFPNLFGKWCRPNYNSAVATFCHAAARDLPYTVNDPATELTLCYIDDLVEEMLDALEGREHRCRYEREDSATEVETSAGEADTDAAPVMEGYRCIPDANSMYGYVPVIHQVTLGEIDRLLRSFQAMPRTLVMPEIPEGSLAKKLYSTYLSYLPPEKMCYGFKSNIDERGNFTELIRTLNCGQVSINVAKPGSTRGQHWHNSKWEIFIVVSGHGLIQERCIGTDPATGEAYPVHSFEVTGEEMKAVQMLPGYTHNIINLSKTQDLVTVMWANEAFDPAHPDTFFEAVEDSAGS